MLRNRFIPWLALGLAGLLFSGCGEEFDPYWRILDFRVLAIKSSQPELRPNETADLEALTFAPDGDEVTYAWSWCPTITSGGDGFECPFTQEELDAAIAAALGLDEVPPGIGITLDLGTEPTAELPYPGTAEVVLGFCRAIQDNLANLPPEAAGIVPSVDCARGLDVTVRLETSSGGKTIVSGKRINLWTESFQENNNPDVTGIQIRPADTGAATWLLEQGASWVIDPAEPKDNWWVTLNPADPFEIWADVPFEIRSLVDPDSVEIWQPPAPQGSDEAFLPPESEVIVFRWMGSGGSFANPDRIFSEDLNTLEEASISEFEVKRIREEEDDYDADGILNGDDTCPYVPGELTNSSGVCVMTVWSIIRDGRYGLDFVQNTLLVPGRRK